MQANSLKRAALMKTNHHTLQRLPPVRVYPLLLLLCLAVSGCQTDARTSSPATKTLAPTAATTTQPTPTPQSAFPAFSGWRIAYTTENGALHIITLDGKTDLTGPVLVSPGATNPIQSLWGQAVSAPDGRAIAYPGGVIDLRSGIPAAESILPVNGGMIDGGKPCCWSPDSTHVVFYTSDVHGNYFDEVLDISTGKSTVIPGTQGIGPQYLAIIGWIDTTHLAVYAYNSDETAIIVSAINSTTGAMRKIATFDAQSLGNVHFDISPDGTEIVLTNAEGEGVRSFVPVADLINTSTGQIRPLPTILSVTQSDLLGGLIWKPGTQLALAQGYPGSYLLDLAQDTATPFATNLLALGWKPDSGMLYVSTVPTDSLDQPHTFQLGMMAAPPPATAMQPAFSLESTIFPYLGFVRSA